MTQNNTTSEQPGAKKLLARMAGRFGVDDDKLAATLRATVFNLGKDEEPVTNEELMMLLVVAEEHNLNPFTKEIYAFVKDGKVVPIVSVDGWSRIINDHPEFNGVEFVMQPHDEWAAYKALKDAKPCPDWMDCKIFRKDRQHPTVIREYLDETYNGGSYARSPWRSHTKRMLRHKTLIQCARVAFSFSGIYDEDEGRRIIEGESVVIHEPATPQQAVETLRATEGDAPKALTADTRANALDDLLAGQIHQATEEPEKVERQVNLERVAEFDRELAEAEAEANA